MPRFPRWVLPAIVLVILLGTASIVYRQLAQRPVPPAVRDSIAVIAAAKRPDSIAHAQVLAKAETVYVMSRAQSDSSLRIATHANEAKVHAAADAERARNATTARDSATYWQLAYFGEQRRGDSLDAALLVERRASESARAATVLAVHGDSLSQARLARVEALNVSVTSELQRATSGCKLLPLVACPSRTQTAAGVAIATYFIARKVKL